MKITVVAVSAPALYQLNRYRQEFQQRYGENRMELSMFYVAGANPGVLGLQDKIKEAVKTADAVVIDIMGASEALQDVVREGLAACRGQRIVIGNGCREYIRLGAFSMEGMKKQSSAPAEAERPGPQEKKTKKNAAALMHTMRRMALMMGSVAPFGMMKDMKNVFLLIDYWQQAQEEDMDSFMHLLLRTYFGMKELPKEKPCSMRYGIYLKNPETGDCQDSLKSYWKANTYQKDKRTVALLFYGHSYPNDFQPVVQAMYHSLGRNYNVLPIAFSQNEDRDLKKLEAFLCSPVCPISAAVNLMPFRLGAGPMGGNARGAVQILERLNVPYFKPLCITKAEKSQWEHESAVNPGEFLISILLPELDGGIHTYPVGVMEKLEEKTEAFAITRIAPIEERIESLCGRIGRFIRLKEKENGEKKLALICYNYPPGEDNLFGGAFLDTFASVSAILRGLKADGYQTENMSPEKLREIFCGDGRCNAPQWAEPAQWDFSCSIDGKQYPVKGIQNVNVFIGLQPSRVPEGAEDKASYHDRNAAPTGEYQAFYRWVCREYQADAMIHVGTHGTLEFLPGRESGMMQDCWPDRLAGDVPHFYFYYIGNPSEAMTAKRRSHAVLLGYQPPAFERGGLYGVYEEIKEMIAEYRESAQNAPERCQDLLYHIGVQAHASGLMEEGAEVTEKILDVIEEQLYDYEITLIPGGLHTIGQGYSREEAEAYAGQVMEHLPQEKTEEEKHALEEQIIKNAMENREIEGMLRALRGEYLPVGTGGDILKSPDLLPTGRNLVQFDPRLVPTRTAFERGKKIAAQTLERYRKCRGCWPDSTAVILWGLETSKSQGETMGQILYYLGVRMKQFEGSFDSRFEIIPTEEMDRPRVDVVIHICGFFRDMFPNLVENLNEIFRKLDMLDETDAQSGFAKNTRKNRERLLAQGYSPEEAAELSRSRIFGPKEGEYGTRLTEKVRKGTWKEAAELGQAFTEDLSYVYSSTKKGVCTKGLLNMNYKTVQMISQVRNNVEYELADLDHYYEFYGGLSKAVEIAGGEKAELYVADTTGKEVRTEDFSISFEKGIRTRLLNPKWIEGMMKHDYHGVQQISRRFENVMGFASTTDRVGSRIFSDMEKCYVEDANLRRRMQASNRWAYLSMLGRLMEARNRGYWDASEEELMQVRSAYLETEGDMER